MRVLVTRPLEEAAATAAALAAMGIEALVDPLLEIRPLPGPAVPLDGVQALLFTSANGVRAFAAREGRRDLPVYAIGERTAEAARALGFATVESARGAVAELAALVQARVDPAKGALLHGAGAVVKGDLGALLAPAGFSVRRVVLYEAAAAAALSPATAAALRGRKLDAVLFFSPRSAETFVSLARGAGLAEACARLTALCLSPPVEAAARAIAWRALRVAERPEQAALLAFLTSSRDEAEPVEQNDDKPDGPRAGLDGGAVGRAIRAFGGLRPMAAKLGVPVTTVQGWKERGHIPEARIADLLAAAARHGIALDEAALGAGTAAGDPPGAPPSDRRDSAEPEPATATPPAPAAAAGAASSVDSEPAQQSRPSRQARGSASPRRALSAGLWAAAGAALLLAAALSLPYWAAWFGLEAAGEPAVNERLAALGQGQAALERRLAALDAQVKAGRAEGATGDSAGLAAKQAGLAASLGGVERRMAALERALAELADRLETQPGIEAAALTERMNALTSQGAELQQRLAALEAAAGREAAAAARRAALVLAVGQLREALQRSTPYASALEPVAALAAGAPALEPGLAELKAHAGEGVPTRTELAARFDAVSLAAARASMAPARPGWLGQALARLSRLVVIRRSPGEVAGDGPDAVLARAEARVAAGDLAGAVAALAPLEGAAADTVRPWLADARARLAVDAALDSLTSQAIARLKESGS